MDAVRQPFIGLTPFAEEHAAFFFGRTRERDLVIANLTTRRLTLLYGPSGVGKTSLLEAGVVTHVREVSRRNLEQRGKPGALAVSFATWGQDPIRTLVETIRNAVTTVTPEIVWSDIETLDDTLETWTSSRNGDLLIILDQFEQFFTHHAGAERATFVRALASCVSRRDFNAHLLIAIREDWLSSLDIFKGQLPGLFDNYLRLQPLGYEAAREAIVSPVAKHNELFRGSVTLAPDLVDAVLKQSRRGRGRLAKDAPLLTGASFEPPAIQLIMERLWRETVEDGTGTISASTLQKLTRRHDIVDQYVERVLGGLTFREQGYAAKLFDRLVTPSGIKIAQTYSSLQGFLASGGLETLLKKLPQRFRWSGARLDPLLDKLTTRPALLNQVTPPRDVDEPCYEIAHDVLAASLARWQARHAQRRHLTIAAGVLCIITAGLSGWAYREMKAQSELSAKNEELERLLKEIQNLRRVTASVTPPITDNPPPASTGAITREKLWSPGQTLRVGFMDGSEQLRNRVKETLAQWTLHANIRLAYVAAGDAEVRITFRCDGSWSYISTEALAVPPTEPTVCYGFVDERTPDDEFNSSVLHEFGHCLGLVHEFARAGVNIPWNKPAVYKFMAATQGWNRSTVDETMFKQDGKWLPTKPFDPKSIMMYAFPASFTTDGREYQQPKGLSDMDKRYIRELYPAPTTGSDRPPT